VEEALAKGARAVTGCAPGEGPGAFYRPSILDGVRPGMRVWTEEVFGPVALVVRVRDEAEALAVANGSASGRAMPGGGRAQPPVWDMKRTTWCGRSRNSWRSGLSAMASRTAASSAASPAPPRRRGRKS